MRELNYERVFNVLVKETSNYMTKNHLNAMVLGISGGIDSTVVAAICHEVSKQTGIPLIGRSLPIRNKKDEFSISELVGEAFCDDFCSCNLYQLFDNVNKAFKGFEYDHSLEKYGHSNNYGVTAIQEGNIQARLRMIYLYNLASVHKGLVMSTDNQTEYQLGFWTIHGDVGDFDPIQGLWKTEVYGLANWLLKFHYPEVYFDSSVEEIHKVTDMMCALRESIALTPTDGLGISNSDLDQIGAKSYYDVDRVLQTITCKASPENDKLQDELTAELGPDVVGKILQRRFNSGFKRLLSPIIVPRELYD